MGKKIFFYLSICILFLFLFGCNSSSSNTDIIVLQNQTQNQMQANPRIQDLVESVEDMDVLGLKFDAEYDIAYTLKFSSLARLGYVTDANSRAESFMLNYSKAIEQVSKQINAIRKNSESTTKKMLQKGDECVLAIKVNNEYKLKVLAGLRSYYEHERYVLIWNNEIDKFKVNRRQLNDQYFKLARNATKVNQIVDEAIVIFEKLVDANDNATAILNLSSEHLYSDWANSELTTMKKWKSFVGNEHLTEAITFFIQYQDKIEDVYRILDNATDQYEEEHDEWVLKNIEAYNVNSTRLIAEVIPPCAEFEKRLEDVSN